MLCKKCGKKTVVLDTALKGSKGLIVARKRLCEKCLREFKTVETEIE